MGRRFAQQADLFILSLLGTTTFAILWSITGFLLFFWIFIISATVLFGSVPWSKLAHMFFKPAAAFQRRVNDADGSRENLPHRQTNRPNSVLVLSEKDLVTIDQIFCMALH